MPTPLKPCDGHFVEGLQEILSKNQDRAQWATHPCEVCGAEVGAVWAGGKWVPEQHWPSVKYPARAAGKKPEPSRNSGPQSDEITAEEVALQ